MVTSEVKSNITITASEQSLINKLFSLISLMFTICIVFLIFINSVIILKKLKKSDWYVISYVLTRLLVLKDCFASLVLNCTTLMLF